MISGSEIEYSDSYDSYIADDELLAQ